MVCDPHGQRRTGVAKDDGRAWAVFTPDGLDLIVSAGSTIERVEVRR